VCAIAGKRHRGQRTIKDVLLSDGRRKAEVASGKMIARKVGDLRRKHIPTVERSHLQVVHERR
jgi:hypothetical protein